MKIKVISKDQFPTTFVRKVDMAGVWHLRAVVYS